jgi:CAAX prenyl protease-like protein
MVPIAEELAFRGLLHRWLISRRFDTVAFAQFSWLAFVVSSLLFGFMHQRWIAGALAGAVFALVMYRSGRLSDAIAAHMAANAVVLHWAIAVRNWAPI